MKRFIAIVLLVPVMCAAGCSGKGDAGDLGGAVDDYNKGNYAQAHKSASEAMRDSQGTEKDEAAYLAGLSAYQMRDMDEAERRWMASSNSSDPHVAARSKAMLGQLYLDRQRPREAAELLATASATLEGDDARQAAHRAGIAFQQAGDSANAQKYLAIGGYSNSTSTIGTSVPQRATSGVSTTAKTSTSTAPMSPTGYSLQVGAFNELNRAKRAADDAERLAKKESLGPVKLFSKHDDHGRRFFIVHLGKFTTRDEAAAAKARLGRLEYVVTPAMPGTS